MAANWQTVELPKGSIPVSNVLGMYVILPAEAAEKYRYWNIYRKPDGTLHMYFSKRIHRALDEVVDHYNIVKLSTPK